MEQISILMLEDSALDAELTGTRLKKATSFHAHFDRVDSEADFVNALETNRYDLILADFSLPNFTGQQAMEIAQVKAPDLPFIFVSGVLGEEVAVDMLQRGATDYVLKQRLERLIPAVNRALSEARERRERRLAEAALRESEVQYRTLVEAVPLLIWTCGPDGTCDFLNSKWVEYTGIAETEQLGTGWRETIHPEDRDRVAARWEGAMNGVATDYEIDFRLRSRSGEYRWFQTRAVAVRDADGRIVKWFGSSTDIENQKQAEQTLIRQREALARSNSDLQQFAYVASHDLQEPLRSVISYTQLLQRRYEGQLGPDADEFIRYAVEGATRMHKLIQDLLDYSLSSVENGHVRGLVSAEGALRSALSNLSAALEEAQAEITYDRLPNVLFNQSQLAQVFQNLLSNSIKYRRPDTAPRVHISARRSGWSWLIELKDNGIGFDAKDSERIFGIFQRLHGRSVPGTGMGLAIVKRTIESGGGRIWAYSQQGQGATFSFLLPAA